MTTAPRTFPFAFAVCQIGAEGAVKADVARAHPGWRFAFSRPGLLTWRCDPEVTLDARVGSLFARVAGASLGRASDAREALARIASVGPLEAPLHLAVFERDRAKPGDEAPGDAYGPLAHEVRQVLVAEAPAADFGARGWAEGLPAPGALVCDVVVAPQEPWLIGLHRHHAGEVPHPGGRVPLSLPPEAPSRAWLKLEEGLSWSGLPMKRGDVAVEVGSAPGGASWALLQRGLTVVGVDPGLMDERVRAHPNFLHLHLKLGDVRREQLPERVDWLLMDVNLAPQVALHQIRRLVSTMRGTLRGALFTLKLNDWDMAADVPALLERVRSMGFTSVAATQLPSNRQEICVAARMRG